MEKLPDNKKLEQLMHILAEASKRKASDVHLTPRSPLMVRIDGKLTPCTKEMMTPAQIEDLVFAMLDERQAEELKERGELDFAFTVAGYSRIRVNAYRRRGEYAAALRVMSDEIPKPWELDLPKAVVGLTTKKRGLVLVTGATGSGKSTTLASLINVISEKYPKHIITLEDPIEYIHNHKKSIVNQREIGYDSKSYANGLRAALREDPDVILVGEMRDLETISTAITAAETGHLVFSTLHTNDTSSAVDRMIDIFPPHQQEQIRVQLASVIEGIIAQQLLPKIDGGRVAAFEVLLANSAIRNLVRKGKAFQIPSIIQTSKKAGMQMMDDSIFDLYMRGTISKETAVAFAQDQEDMTERVKL
ncbi:MAG: type IV pilus twitching motility protein PilT [Lachnospiraceae bacterium]